MAFIENGFTSSLNFLIPEVNRNNNDEIIVDKEMRTSFNGIYACGDCTTGVKQIANAITSAQIAANSAAEYVKSRKW